MKQVFDYLDYRDMLKDAYEEGKASDSILSYRTLAARLGTDASYLFRVLHKEQHLPARCVPKALEFLALGGRSAEYFQMLLAYGRTRGKVQKQEILDKAFGLRDVERRRMTEKELDFFRNWWVAGVRCLLEITGGNVKAQDLAQRFQPAVSTDEVRKALDLLLELGMVKRVSSDRLLPAETHVVAGGDEKVLAVRTFQAQVLDLAKQSLERYPPDMRDVSTLTLALDADAFRDIREMLRECRRQIQKRVEGATRPDRVLELSMAFFPIVPPVDG